MMLSGLGLAMLSLVACSKNDGNGPIDDPNANLDTKNMKFTFSVTGINIDDMDHASLTFSGTDSKGTTTVWQLNGEILPNERGFSVSQDKMKDGSTFVVESIVPLASAGVSISVVNSTISDNTPMHLKFKAEVNGKVGNDIDETINEYYTKSLSF